MKSLFVNKELFSHWKALLVLILACSITASSVWYLGHAIPAPSRNSVVTPGGQAVPCTYHNYQDGGRFLGKNCKTGDNDFSETTASALWNDELANNVAIYWEGGTWDFSGGVSILFNGVTMWGIYNSTILKCSTGACVAVTIGNQNAVDSIYHAQNVYLHDLTFEGGQPSVQNGAGLSIATAYGVYLDHFIVEKAGEVGVGGFRIDNWNNQQILNKNIYVHDGLFLGTKIGISGCVNGFLEYSTFQGFNQNAVGSTALVDFSKGDISPTGANMLSNFDFDHNTFTGWTGIWMQGFQAVNNDTITYNFVQDVNGIMNTVAVTGPQLNGLLVNGNTFAKDTGSVTFAYGNNFQITNNQWLLDKTPAGGSSALIIDGGACIAPNCPVDVLISGNQISKWGGIGMILNFSRGSVTSNDIYNVNQVAGNNNLNPGLFIDKGLTNAMIYGNSIVSDVASGAGASRAVDMHGAAKNVTMIGNYLLYRPDTSPGGAIFFEVAKDATFQLRYNRGYVTENQGSCSISASTTCSVTHGLASTPTAVLITAGTIGTGVYYVTSVGASTFTITVTTSGSYTMYWEARYWP